MYKRKNSISSMQRYFLKEKILFLWGKAMHKKKFYFYEATLCIKEKKYYFSHAKLCITENIIFLID